MAWDHSPEKQRLKSIKRWGDQTVRFWKGVLKKGPSDCWLWIGHKAHCGYGELTFNGIQQRAHRVSWQIHNGPIPKGLCVLHHCDNPPCVNPAHLFVDTKAKNTEDMMRKGRHRFKASKGSKNGCAKLTEESVIKIRHDYAIGLSNIPRLAKEYDVNNAAIWRVIHRLKWKHV